jgi:hypothetical protein
MPAYKWFLAGRIDPQSEQDRVWPLPSREGGWVKMGGSLGRLAVRKTVSSTASTLRSVPDGIWDELWEVELDQPRTNDAGVVIAKRGRLVRRIDAWDETAARTFHDEAHELRRQWGTEIVSMIPADASLSDPAPMFLMSAILSSHALGGWAGSSYTSAQLNRIIQQNVADAFRLAAGFALPGEGETEETAFERAQTTQNGSLFAAGCLFFARKLKDMGYRCDPDFDWFLTMNAGWDAEHDRQVAWFKRELNLES